MFVAFARCWMPPRLHSTLVGLLWQSWICMSGSWRLEWGSWSNWRGPTLRWGAVEATLAWTSSRPLPPQFSAIFFNTWEPCILYLLLTLCWCNILSCNIISHVMITNVLVISYLECMFYFSHSESCPARGLCVYVEAPGPICPAYTYRR